jgi:hypothetical protein
MNVPNPERHHIRRGKATVSWGPRHFGKPSIIATAPVEAIDDLVAAVQAAQAEIQGGNR